MTTRSVLTLIAAPLLAVPVGCAGDSSEITPGSPASATQNVTHGPFFPECGGVTAQTITQLTQVTDLVTAARNSVGCQWVTRRGLDGPEFWFTWYRGSPLGRERKNEELMRSQVKDISISGHRGWIAVGSDTALGDYLCVLAIQFSDDFIEWSASFTDKPFPNPCDVIKELMGRSIAAAK